MMVDRRVVRTKARPRQPVDSPARPCSSGMRKVVVMIIFSSLVTLPWWVVDVGGLALPFFEWPSCAPYVNTFDSYCLGHVT